MKNKSCTACYDGTHVFVGAVNENVPAGGQCSECAGTCVDGKVWKRKAAKAVEQLMFHERCAGVDSIRDTDFFLPEILVRIDLRNDAKRLKRLNK